MKAWVVKHKKSELYWDGWGQMWSSLNYATLNPTRKITRMWMIALSISSNIAKPVKIEILTR